MGQLADTIKPVVSGRVYTCKVDLICEDEADREAVNRLMKNPDMSCRSIARQIGVSEGTVYKHRSKDCQCYKGRR